MPELASQTTRPPQDSCPSTEDLACYIDGVLSPEEAARVAEHLASCESCFEVYSGVLQFQLEEEPAPGGKVVPFPPVKGPAPMAWRWASIAALLVVGVGFGGYSYLLAPPPVLETTKLSALGQGKAGLNPWRGPVMRGASEGDETRNEVSPDWAAFRTGVQVVNLQVGLAANQVREAQDAIAGIYGMLGTQYSTGGLQNSYKELTGAVGDAKTPSNLLARASQLAKESRELLDPLYFDLGQWVEAGYLAATSQDSAFFRRPENRSFLRHALWRDRLGFKDSKLPAGSRQDLEQIYQIAGQDTLQPADFAKLQGHFTKILDANYPQ